MKTIIATITVVIIIEEVRQPVNEKDGCVALLIGPSYLILMREAAVGYADGFAWTLDTGRQPYSISLGFQQQSN